MTEIITGALATGAFVTALAPFASRAGDWFSRERGGKDGCNGWV